MYTIAVDGFILTVHLLCLNTHTLYVRMHMTSVFHPDIMARGGQSGILNGNVSGEWGGGGGGGLTWSEGKCD